MPQIDDGQMDEQWLRFLGFFYFISSKSKIIVVCCMFCAEKDILNFLNNVEFHQLFKAMKAVH